MNALFESATKIVLLLLCAVLCSVVVVIVLNNLENADIIVPVVLVFTNTITAVTSFYFGQKTTLWSQTYNKPA